MSDTFYSILPLKKKTTKSDFFDFFDFFMFLLLFVVHNCRNEAIYITKSDLFYKHFFICNPKLCINQAIKVTKSDFFYIDFFDFRTFLLLFVVHNCRNGEINVSYVTKLFINIFLFVIQNFVLTKK